MAVGERFNGGGVINAASGINADGTGTTGSAGGLILRPFSTARQSAASALVSEVKPESCPNTFLLKDNQLRTSSEIKHTCSTSSAFLPAIHQKHH